MESHFLALKRACARLTKVASAEAQARAGLHGAQAQALLVLSEFGDCRISELGSKLDLGKPATTTLVNRMEKARLLQRKRDRNDSRASIIELTSTGRRAVDDVEQMIAGLDRRLTEGFSATEVAIIMKYLAHASQIDKL